MCVWEDVGWNVMDLYGDGDDGGMKLNEKKEREEEEGKGKEERKRK